MHISGNSAEFIFQDLPPIAFVLGVAGTLLITRHFEARPQLAKWSGIALLSLGVLIQVGVLVLYASILPVGVGGSAQLR